LSVREDPGRSFARSTYVYGRLLGVVFLIAFVSFHAQLDGLVGDHGIVPASELLEAARAYGYGFWDMPTLAWGAEDVEGALENLCIAGELVSLALAAGVLSGPASLIAAVLYLSLMNAADPFMGFQWDALLVESGIASALLLPWQPFERWSRAIEPPVLGRWALYFLLFRLVFLSGVVKLASGDEAWHTLAALDYHYSTQPLPNPASWLAHQLPGPIQSLSTFVVLYLELVVPFTILSGRYGRRTAAAGIGALMVGISLTGNYGFFNLLTIALCLPLLDDRAVHFVLSRRFVRAAPVPRWRAILRACAALPAAMLFFLGASQLVLSLGGGRALPNVALDALDGARRFHAVNGYGLFAVMTTERREIRIEGSLDGREWHEYRFAHKPGDPSELPGISAPHMPRLDWQMWFAALGHFEDSPWLVGLMRRLLEARPEVLGLLEHDPFYGSPPRFVRARLYDYELGDLELLAEHGAYWRVTELGPYGPTLSSASFRGR
jgi:hypothetical protein